MMARMGAERVQTGGSVGRMASLVEAYARRVAPAVLEQHHGASVSSALGVWLLLAACVSGAQGNDRAALEETLGCSADEAGELLSAFMADPPQALHAAIALWVAVDDATEELAAWTRGLPQAVESGFMPSQAEADAWAERETAGLIRTFPMDIDEYTRVILASALATKVTWQVPFEVVPAASYCGPHSPWKGEVSRLLWDGHAQGHAEIVQTEAAGLVAVHCAIAKDDLTIVSVSGAPEVDRAAVLAAGYEVASTVCTDWGRGARSLFDLPLGRGHSWEISEHEVGVYMPEPRLEQIEGAALPAWRGEGELQLMRSDAFGTEPAVNALLALIGPRANDETGAKQAAVASFSRYGFEAAAVTALVGFAASAARPPRDRAIKRRATLCFDHPYAAVAIAGRPIGAGAPAQPASPFAGMPLFSAWVHEPVEPEDEPGPD